MKRSSKSLTGFSITATDGEIGSVTDFYFDDETWTVRYLVVEAGSWLSGRKVLISPQAITGAGWEAKTFHVNLTKEQVQNSPDVDTDKPVSRQHEVELNRHYPWRDYWTGAFWAGGIGTTGMMVSPTPPLTEAVRQGEPQREEGDPHLRSIDRVTGYVVKAADGQIGDVEDFLLDEEDFRIDFFVVDTGNWFPGKKVVLSPQWLRRIDWMNSEVTVEASVEQVKNSPEFDPEEPLTDGQAEALQAHYGRSVSTKP